MIQYLVDQHGRYIKALSGTTDEIVKEVPEGYTTTVLPPPRTTDYWNGTQWIAIGAPPAWYLEYDYETKNWRDNRNLEDAKRKKWEEIKLERNKIEFGGFMFKGKLFDSDYISQGRILAAVFFGQPTNWTAADDSTVELSVEDLKELGATMASHVNAAHYRSRLARQVIEASQSAQEVDSVVF